MIKAVFYKNNNRFSGYEIRGHSGYAKRGKDIVCASVSSLTIHTTNIIDEECTKATIQQNDDTGLIKVSLEKPSSLSDMLIRHLILTLKEIQNEYSGYLLVEVKEE
ncbi:MAG TPA: ribosomal-processing cysteine protease Prp [Thermotogota bacterium]|nr:ribosomal-processing cysteine protease Prp [Thermotogota bacterium]HRW33871.1 ribosomal-processing cysteine protease Prp [Thermotogota bacterium]